MLRYSNASQTHFQVSSHRTSTEIICGYEIEEMIEKKFQFEECFLSFL